jgi:hypothetical protein
MPLASSQSREAIRDTVREAFRVEERGIDWRSGLAGAVVAVGPLAVGVALDETVAGLTAAIGGLNTALCVPRAGLRARMFWGPLCAVAGAGSLALGDGAHPHTWSLVLATVVWVGLWGTLRAAGPPGALTGFATAAVLVILGGIPVGPESLGQRMLWYVLGAVPALVLMVLVRRGPAPPPDLARSVLRAVVAGVRGDAGLRAHVARLSIAVAVATLLYRLIDLPHGYWVPLTVLAVMQPGEHATRVRAIQRAAGTLAGAALIVLITLVTDDAWALVACAAASAFWLYALDERGYFWLVVMLTPTALLMLSLVDFQGVDEGLERVANSALGIAIGLAISAVVRELATWRARRRGDQPAA